MFRGTITNKYTFHNNSFNLKQTTGNLLRNFAHNYYCKYIRRVLKDIISFDTENGCSELLKYSLKYGFSELYRETSRTIKTPFKKF